MKSLRFFQAVVCFVVMSVGLASGDSLELRNGRHIQGKYVGGTSNAIGFMTSGSVEYFSTTDIVALVFDNNPDTTFNGIQPNASVPNNGCQGDLQPAKAPKSKKSRSNPRIRQTTTVLAN